MSKATGSVLSHRWRFFKRYLADPTVVGAVAPSSRALADALCKPFCNRISPATVLEVGAGTGAITQYLSAFLGEHDRLDICEIQPEFADIIEQTVLTRTDLIPAVACGRVRLIRAPVQNLTEENRYDFVICGLPLTAFELREVKDVFRVIRRALKPGGLFSYFEYVGMRRASRIFTIGGQRKRIALVSAYLSHKIRRYQFDRQTVLQNIPPAHARHLRFD